MSTLPDQYRDAFNADLDPATEPGLTEALATYRDMPAKPGPSHPVWDEVDAFYAGWQARGIHDAAHETWWAVCVCGDGTPENPRAHTPIDITIEWTRREQDARAYLPIERAHGNTHAHLISRTIHND